MSDRLPMGFGVSLLVAGFAGIMWTDLANDTLRGAAVPSTIAWFLVAFGGYLALLRQQSPMAARSRWRWLLVLGLGLRLVMVATEPTLSDDVYRYLWEGHLVTEGVSPYSFTIDSPLGDLYNIPARGLANNTSLASPYLPVAHAIFGAAAAVLPSQPWTMQLLMIGFDVLGAAMIIKLLKAVGLPERRVLLYWLNPLVIIEVAHGAHIDAIIVGLVGLGLWLSLEKSTTSLVAHYAGPIVIAAATLTRPLGLLLLPVLFWAWNWRQRATWATAFVAPIGVAAATTSFGLGEAQGGTGVFGSARAYTDTFRFNSGIYHWFEGWIGGRGLDDMGWNEPAALTRLVVAVVMGAVMVWVFLVARGQRDTRSRLRLAVIPVMAYALLTPVLHPWYTLLCLAMLPFVAPGPAEQKGRWLLVVPWVVLSALLIFSYLTYEDPAAFAEREWIRRLEWYPTLGLLGIAMIWSFQRRSAQRL